MGFLAPWFLAGIVAIGLPLWLHLLKQFRRTPQPFSSLMFFERRLESSITHRRLRYLTLLALRIALLALLALAFANPFVNRTITTRARRKLTVIAIDRSFSMRYGDRMQQAKAHAHRLLDSLRGRSLAQVIAVDSRIEALTQPETDKGTLSAAIDSIQPDDLASSFGEFARALRVMDQSTGMRLDVHFISDMQRTSMPPAFADLRVGPHTALDLVCIGEGSAANWTLESVNAPPHVYDPAHTRVVATIAGWQTPEASRKVSLLLDGKVIASKEVNVPANGRAQVEFLSFDVPYGAHRGEVRIEPHDNLRGDDTFPFALERSDPRNVLFLYAAGRAREAFYYTAAMQSATDTGLTVQSAPIERAMEHDFSKYAFIILGDTGELDESISGKLTEYVQKGGSLLISLGPSSIRAGRVAITGDRIADLRQTQGAGFVDNQNPALTGVGHLDSVQFCEAAQVSVRKARVMARLADGSPLLLEEALGEGRILTFASTLDNSTSDFPLHASFLPFVVQTARYLAGADEMPSSVIAGTPVELRRSHDRSAPADVIGPEGKHELPLGDAAHATAFDVQREGFYEVQRANGRRTLVAAHADRRESDLRTVPEETLALWRNTGSTAAEAQPASVERQTVPRSLWRYALILVLLVALTESVFASRYLKERRQDT